MPCHDKIYLIKILMFKFIQLESDTALTKAADPDRFSPFCNGESARAILRYDTSLRMRPGSSVLICTQNIQLNLILPARASHTLSLFVWPKTPASRLAIACAPMFMTQRPHECLLDRARARGPIYIARVVVPGPDRYRSTAGERGR